MSKNFNEWVYYEKSYVNGKIRAMSSAGNYIENLNNIKKINEEYNFFRNKNISVIEYILNMMDDIDYNSFENDKTLKLFLEFKKSFIDLFDFLEINNELKNKSEIFDFYTLIEWLDMSYIYLIEVV